MLYVAGPGHGGPAVVANVYLEGTYSEIYPHVSADETSGSRPWPTCCDSGGSARSARSDRGVRGQDDRHRHGRSRADRAAHVCDTPAEAREALFEEHRSSTRCAGTDLLAVQLGELVAGAGREPALGARARRVLGSIGSISHVLLQRLSQSRLAAGPTR